MNVKFSFDKVNFQNKIEKPVVKISPPQSGGTTNYNYLQNKPKINNVELIDNKSLEDLGIQENEALSNLEIEEVLKNFI